MIFGIQLHPCTVNNLDTHIFLLPLRFLCFSFTVMHITEERNIDQISPVVEGYICDTLEAFMEVIAKAFLDLIVEISFHYKSVKVCTLRDTE